MEIDKEYSDPFNEGRKDPAEYRIMEIANVGRLPILSEAPASNKDPISIPKNSIKKR
jgi:hypothetical protein